MDYVVSLIPPDVDCTSCKTNELVSSVYDVLFELEQEEALTVEVGGSFFGYVKGFKMNPDNHSDSDTILYNHIRVEDHLDFGYQAHYVMISEDVYYTKELDSLSYRALFEDYLYHYAVGLEVGGKTLEHLNT